MYVSAVALHVHRFSLVTAIPALVALVHDLFVVRASNKPTDVSKDVDTQREVLISMLLKLTQHYQVLEMFIIVLHHSRRESEDKWKRLSRQVTDKVRSGVCALLHTYNPQIGRASCRERV